MTDLGRLICRQNDPLLRGANEPGLKAAHSLGIDPNRPETMTPGAMSLLKRRLAALGREKETLDAELRREKKVAEAFGLIASAMEEIALRAQWPSPIKAALKSYQHVPLCRPVVESLKARGRKGSALPRILKSFERATGFLIASDVSADALARCEEFGRDLVSAGCFRQPYPDTLFEFSLSGHHIALLLRSGSMSPLVFAPRYGAWLPTDIEIDMFRSSPDFMERLALGLCVLIDSRSVDVAAPTVARRRRATQPDEAPSIVYRRVTIRSARGGRGDLCDGAHASPRLHWRRGHFRHLRSGAVVPVSPCVVGSAERGVVLKDYAIRRAGAND